jgi:O-antigen/teichoic acid export membrane protein
VSEDKSIVKGVARNTSVMLLQYMITWGASFVGMLFLPRYLGPVEYGRLYLATSLVALFRVLVEYGGNYLVAKDVSRSRETTGQIVVDAIALRLVLATFAFAGVITIALTAGYPGETNLLLAIVGAGLFGHGAIIVFSAAFQGHEKLRYSSAASIVNSVFGNVLSIIAVILWRRAWIIGLLGVMASTLQLATMVYYSRRIIASIPGVRWSGIFRHMQFGLSYFLFGIFSAVYYRIDTVMLSKMSPEEVVGWYGGAYKLFEAMNFFPFIFTTAVYPVLSRLWKQETTMHRRTTQKSLEFMILVGVPVTVGLVMFARIPVQILYGLEGYTPAVVVLQVLAGGLLFLFIDMVLGTALLASDRQRQQSMLALGAIPVNIGLNLLLIPYFQEVTGNGGIGAALATGLTEFAIMIVMFSILPGGVLAGFRVSVVFKSLAGGGIMAAIAGALLAAGTPGGLCAIVAGLAYVPIIMMLGTLEPDENRFVRSLFTVTGFRSAIRTVLSEDSVSPQKGS